MGGGRGGWHQEKPTGGIDPLIHQELQYILMTEDRHKERYPDHSHSKPSPPLDLERHQTIVIHGPRDD